jgi:hypothetical protein
VFGVLVQGDFGQPVSEVAQSLSRFLRLANSAGSGSGRFVQLSHDFPASGWAQSAALCFGFDVDTLTDDFLNHAGVCRLHLFNVSADDVLDFCGYKVSPGIEASADVFSSSIGPFFGLGWLRGNVESIWPGGVVDRHGVRVKMDRCFPFRPEYRGELALIPLSKSAVIYQPVVEPATWWDGRRPSRHGAGNLVDDGVPSSELALLDAEPDVAELDFGG